MVNVTPVGLDINGFKLEFDPSTMKIIYAQYSGIDGTPVTLHNKEDGTNCQVPSGKIWTIIYITTFDRTVASHTLIQSDDLDGNTNAVTLFAPPTDVSNILFLSAELPAGKYLTMDSGTANQHEADVIILEEDE